VVHSLQFGVLKGAENHTKPISINSSTKDVVNLSVCLIKYHVMKKYGGVAIQLHTLLTSALDRGYWLAAWSGLRIQGEIEHRSHLTDGRRAE
jgi:hypothetical protein